MPIRIEVNIKTGEVKEIDLTQAEIDAANAAAAAEVPRPKTFSLEDVISVLPQATKDAMAAKVAAK